MKKLIPYILILSTLATASLGLYTYYLKHTSQQLVENWIRIEQVNIQQGNIFSSLASSNRMLMFAGVIKSVMLFDVQHDQVNEMASYGEYMTFVKPPELAPGANESRFTGLYEVVTFVKFRERPNLVAAFKIESPDSALLFAFMLGGLTTIVIGFALYIQKLARHEESRRIAIINGAMEDLLHEVSPRKFVVDQMPHILGQWSSIRHSFEQLKEKLENSARDRAMVQTSQMLGHDLRAPLGAFERLLLVPDSEIPAMKGAIKESLNRLYSMVEALRNSEIENIVRRTSTDFSFLPGYENLRLKAEKRNISFLVPQIEYSLMIDKNKIERAWLNLASNAIEFAKASVRVDAQIRGAELIIKVSDDGPGILDDFLPKLFQRGATFGKADGTGLGLAYVRQIMRGHGGDVSYGRNDGWTVFECRIPDAVIQRPEQGIHEQTIAWSEKDKIEIKNVGICFIPVGLGDEIFEHLNIEKSKFFIFSRDYQSSDIIVSNDEDTLLKALAEGKNPVAVDLTMPLEKILNKLSRRFNLARGNQNV